MLGQRRRRWGNNKPAPAEHIVLSPRYYTTLPLDCFVGIRAFYAAPPPTIRGLDSAAENNNTSIPASHYIPIKLTAAGYLQRFVFKTL